jgi:hypothetical protein
MGIAIKIKIQAWGGLADGTGILSIARQGYGIRRE